MRALECKMKTDKNPEDAKAKLALQELVRKFGSVSEAVTVVLNAGDLAAYDIQVLREGMNVRIIT